MDRLRSIPGPAAALAALLLVAATIHLLVPGIFEGIIPGWVPGSRRGWVYASGIAEFGCGAALLLSETRRRAGFATAALFVAVFPANVQMLLDADTTVARVLLAARLPIQLPLIWWALRVASTSSRGQPADGDPDSS